VLQFGIGTTSTESGVGQEIFFGDTVKIKSIICGDYHTLALSETGEIWSWGRNNIALGHSQEGSREIPKKVGGPLENKKVVSIAAGYEHSVAVTGTNTNIIIFCNLYPPSVFLFYKSELLSI